MKKQIPEIFDLRSPKTYVAGITFRALISLYLDYSRTVSGYLLKAYQ